MWSLLRRSERINDRSCPRDIRVRQPRNMSRVRFVVENLETRQVCSAGVHSLAGQAVHHQAETRPFLVETTHHDGVTPAAQVHHAVKGKKQANFTLAQVQKFLPGKWVAVADVSASYGIQGAYTAVEVVFTGPKGAKTFSALSALSVPGLFGRANYFFGDSGTYKFISNKLVRMTITQAGPTSYLGNPVLVMSGQFLGVQFIDKNHFIDQGVTYTREALNQSIFNG